MKKLPQSVKSVFAAVLIVILGVLAVTLLRSRGRSEYPPPGTQVAISYEDGNTAGPVSFVKAADDWLVFEEGNNQIWIPKGQVKVLVFTFHELAPIIK